MWGVYVRPAQRNTGLARTLCARVIELARAEGVRQIHLGVNAENRRARNLYTALGFQIYGKEPRGLCVNGRYYDEEHMVRMLDT